MSQTKQKNVVFFGLIQFVLLLCWTALQIWSSQLPLLSEIEAVLSWPRRVHREFDYVNWGIWIFHSQHNWEQTSFSSSASDTQCRNMKKPNKDQELYFQLPILNSSKSRDTRNSSAAQTGVNKSQHKFPIGKPSPNKSDDFLRFSKQPLRIPQNSSNL